MPNTIKYITLKSVNPISQEHTTKYLFGISMGSLILLSTFFIFRSYYDLQVSNPEAALASLKWNILLSSLFILCFSFLINHFLHQVVNIISEKESAENQAAVKAKFLSTMSHEIRTPMNAVVGLSNILLHEKPRADQVENLQTLKFSADLLLSLINDILDYSKIEAGKITIEKEVFNLKQNVNNIKNALKTKAEEKNIALNLNVAPDVPQDVMGDQVRLSQVLTNLIGNAIKFTSEGSVNLNMNLVEESEKEVKILFAVQDTGIGIPKNKFDKIFKSFSQAEADTTRKFGGTGLGLSITKRLLEIQDSAIQLESEVGKGSTFSFELTFEKSKPVTKTENKIESSFTDFTPFDGESVLLVEDNKINIMVAKKFLSKWNLQIDVAENGLIALQKIQEKDYSLLLMDLNMPVMDGYTATSKIRALENPKYKEVPIIALSASAIAGFRTKAFDAGMDAFVTKPFNPEELYMALSKFVRITA